ncbi:hypothetical protein BGX29_000642 [Mortierella sp. GBA35]|nr:hypothetical protein BGX29_000642 [Mortierella sp. GBA35]
MDFYYLNYRPTYQAGEQKIDFWMLTPEGSPALATGSLELFDEFGKIHLATLVPEGTSIPQAIANKNQPFLWKCWQVPKTLKADFDFSEQFRIVLKTSNHVAAAAKKAAAAAGVGKNNEKRQFDDAANLVDFLLVKNKNKHVNAADNASTLKSMGAGPMVVQDRQFKIKGLTATPGGKPNPAKLSVNSIAASRNPNPNTSTNTDANANSNSSVKSNSDDNTIKDDKTSDDNNGGNNNGSNVKATGAPSSASPARLPRFTAFLVILAATMASFC